ncbi:hypothetical protein D8M05_13930 [Oceanobacillus bengalensis]|uniref:Uncharacterized protein n=1 Tax=Oceanobacillus bengalensis TaxID=1435466 RepID=A0A494YVR6_9BACI|nr:hypothetical protein D8M05_13930 [Oceanobacillus bengalensis]
MSNCYRTEVREVSLLLGAGTRHRMKNTRLGQNDSVFLYILTLDYFSVGNILSNITWGGFTWAEKEQ